MERAAATRSRGLESPLDGAFPLEAARELALQLFDTDEGGEVAQQRFSPRHFSAAGLARKVWQNTLNTADETFLRPLQVLPPAL